MSNWAIDPLSPRHERGGFDCGKPVLSDWLRQHAGQFEKRDLARVFVAARDGSDRVLGYFTLSNYQIAFDELPPGDFGKYPRMPLPTVLIGTLATDLSVRGQGLGQLLLMSALRRIQDIADRTGVCAAIVEAIDDEARDFYLHHDFTALLGDPRRLFMTVRKIRKLGLPPMP
jgi:GNAT superfamily N-acetyltransferase